MKKEHFLEKNAVFVDFFALFCINLLKFLKNSLDK